MYNTQTNYPNYMPVPTTISPQLFFINTAQDLNLLPAPNGINFYYCQQENKIYSRLYLMLTFDEKGRLFMRHKTMREKEVKNDVDS